MSKEKLRTFEHFPKDFECPICNTNEDKECCLIAILGTEDGHIAQATVVHTGCLELTHDKINKVIYQLL